MQTVKSSKKGRILTLTIISGKEVLGLEELILDHPKRDLGLKVTSERALVMFLSKKDFFERVLIPYPELYQ